MIVIELHIKVAREKRYRAQSELIDSTLQPLWAVSGSWIGR
jgi:hypothetical protein